MMKSAWMCNEWVKECFGILRIWLKIRDGVGIECAVIWDNIVGNIG
jgi:hypothetical protein